MVAQIYAGIEGFSMQQIPFFQVDAFAIEAFFGNPAAVCVFTAWPDDAVLKNIAAENNLAETAYLIAEPDSYAIRWFTSLGEIDFCGHASLASAHVVFEHLGHAAPYVKFTTRLVGDLIIRRQDDLYIMDFPARTPIIEVPTSATLIAGFGGVVPQKTYLARDYMLIYPDEKTVRALQPDFRILGELGKMIAVTAAGHDTDYINRFFCPGDAVPEDPVTGSAHCMLAPYWAERLGKAHLQARQYSPRGAADITCIVKGDRVELHGHAVTVIIGTMIL
jgi:predicted PhzF superfamily epimerase YddE/YHI9